MKHTSIQNWLDTSRTTRLYPIGYHTPHSVRQKISKSVIRVANKYKRTTYFYQGLGLRDWIIKHQHEIKNWSRQQLRDHLTPMCPHGKKHYAHSIGGILKEFNLNLKRIDRKKKCMANHKIFDSIATAARHLNIHESLVRRRIIQNRDGYRFIITKNR